MIFEDQGRSTIRTTVGICTAEMQNHSVKRSRSFFCKSRTAERSTRYLTFDGTKEKQSKNVVPVNASSRVEQRLSATSKHV